MSKLNKEINISGHDDIYQMIVDLHADCSEEESRQINAKLIITMINHIGCRDTIEEIIDLVWTNNKKHS
jgi:uncharacterized FlaG/YvyC family protein